MPDFQMRDARDGDQASIRDVTIGAYQEFAPFFQEDWNTYRDSILATLADVGPAEQIVAEQGGVVVGTALLFPPGTAFHTDDAADPDSAAAAPAGPEIRLLAVAPAARGQGIGKALVRECLRRARQSGCKVLTLHTTMRFKHRLLRNG